MQRSGTFSLQHLLRPCLHPGARAALLSHVQTMLRHATLLIHARFQCQRLRSGQLQLLREISPLPNGHTTQPHVKLLNLLPHCHVALTHKLASTLALTPKVAMPPWVLMLHRCLPQLQLAIAPFPRSHAQLPCTKVYYNSQGHSWHSSCLLQPLETIAQLPSCHRALPQKSDRCLGWLQIPPRISTHGSDHVPPQNPRLSSHVQPWLPTAATVQHL